MSYVIQIVAFVGAMFVAARWFYGTPFNIYPCYIAGGVAAAWLCAQIGGRFAR